MQAEVKADNINSIQFLRGIASFLVVLGHSMVGIYFSEESTLSKICSNGSWMGVDVFFIISGFIIPYSSLRTITGSGILKYSLLSGSYV